MNKAFLIEIIKKLTSGIFIGAGVMISIFGVIAFESLSSNPSDSGNQSLMSPILSKIGGTFDRNTMSLEALSEKSGYVVYTTKSGCYTNSYPGHGNGGCNTTPPECNTGDIEIFLERTGGSLIGMGSNSSSRYRTFSRQRFCAKKLP